MASESTTPFLRRSNCVLFVLAATLLIPYGVVTGDHQGYYQREVVLFPTLGVVPSFISAVSSFIILINGADISRWPDTWLIFNLFLDLFLTVSLLGMVIAGYVFMDDNNRRGLMMLGAHGNMLLLFQTYASPGTKPVALSLTFR